MPKFYKYPKSIARELILEAKSLSFHYWLDELDCSVSFHRKSTEKTLDEIINLCETEPAHFTLIERCDSIGRFHDHDHENYYEVGASTLGIGINYFIWILVSIEDGEKLIKKYELS